MCTVAALVPGGMLEVERRCRSVLTVGRLIAGDLDSIKALSPVDATTNPSLILAAVSDPKFSALVDEAIKSAKGATPEEKVAPQQARAPAHTRAGALI